MVWLVVGCGNTEATKQQASRAAPAAAPRPVAVATATVEARSIPTTLDVTGTLAADAQTDVAAEVAGRIVAVLVERGALVKAGTPLARLDSENLQSQLRDAEAQEVQTRVRLGLAPGTRFDPKETPEARMARLNYERAEAEHRRYDGLVEAGAVSRSEFDLKRTDYLSAREQYEATVNQQRQLYEALPGLQARVAMARRALSDAVVRAPYDGLIAERAVSVGQVVPVGGRVATIVRIHPLRVELVVPESVIAAVRKGQKVLFTVQSYADRQFSGTIAYVGPSVRPENRALVAEAVVPNPEALLHPGLFATARIELPATKPMTVVPAVAVRRDGAATKVFVVQGGRVEVRVVQTGREEGGLVEVVGGLKAGERVVTEGVERLTDGAPVTVAAPKTP